MREKEKSGARDVVSASSDVTEALRRTHSLIAGEVAKSAFATQTLAESTAALKELQQTYQGIDGLLAKSRDLVGTLLTSQKSDTWYLRTSFYVLLATLTWLVFRRFLYGPLWWVVWLPVRTTFRVGKGVTSSLAGGGGGASMVVVDQVGGTRTAGLGEEGAVPTVEVGDGKTEKERVDEELAQKIKDVLDREREMGAEVNEAVVAEEAANGGKPNPMKRMWEGEDAEPELEAAVEGRQRDEL